MSAICSTKKVHHRHFVANLLLRVALNI